MLSKGAQLALAISRPAGPRWSGGVTGDVLDHLEPWADPLSWSNPVRLLRMTEIETEITAGLIRDLLRDQHPDLADLPLREVEGGWGNQMWRLGDELSVRIRRMETSPDHQLKERRWLPLLAPRLPLPIPVPVRSGAPSERFPK